MTKMLTDAIEELRKLCERDSPEECGNRPCSCEHSVDLHVAVRKNLLAVLDALDAAQKRIAELEQQIADNAFQGIPPAVDWRTLGDRLADVLSNVLATATTFEMRRAVIEALRAWEEAGGKEPR